jgi:hypothetical protein
MLPTLLGCNQAKTTCASFTIIEPIIIVTNAVTGDAICDATMVASGPADRPGPQLTLTAYTPSTNHLAACEYGGFNSVAGVYAIAVSRDGFQSTTVSDVTVADQVCDSPDPAPAPQVVRIPLTPN